MAVGKVIKGDSFPPPEPVSDKGAAVRSRASVVGAETYEAGQGAKAILAEAEERATARLAQVAEQAKAVLAEAHRQGFEKGKADATQAILKAKALSGQILAQNERTIVELALKMAEKIIGADVQRDPAVLAQMCAAAVESARRSQSLVIRVHPANGERLRAADSVFAGVLGKNVDIMIRDDADVDTAGCIIETEFGTIDAQLKTQLEMLKNALLPDDGKSEGPA